MTSKAENGKITGFRRGFLLNEKSSKRQTRKESTQKSPVAVSSALLEWSEDDTNRNSSSLLGIFRESRNESSAQSSLEGKNRITSSLFIHDEMENSSQDTGIGLKEVATFSRSKPLIAEVESSKYGDGIEASCDNPQEKQDGPITAVASNLESNINATTSDSNQYHIITRQLARALAQMRKRQWQRIAADFVENTLKTSSSRMIVMQTLIDSISTCPRSCRAEHRLVSALVVSSCKSIIQYFQPDGNRKLSMAAVSALLFTIENENFQSAFLVEMLQAIVPVLVDLAVAQKTPTLLARATIDLVYKVFVVSCQQESEIKEYIWQQSHHLDRIWSREIEWITEIGDSSEEEESIVRKTRNIRKECRIAVYKDWKNCLYDCQRLNPETDDISKKWVDELLGKEVGLMPIHVGGLANTLLNGSENSVINDLIGLLESWLVGDKSSNDEVVEISQCIRVVLRSIVSWIGWEKKPIVRATLDACHARVSSISLNLLKFGAGVDHGLLSPLINTCWSESQIISKGMFDGSNNDAKQLLSSTIRILDGETFEAIIETPVLRMACSVVAEEIYKFGLPLFNELLHADTPISTVLAVSLSLLNIFKSVDSVKHTPEDLVSRALEVIYLNFWGNTLLRSEIIKDVRLFTCHRIKCSTATIVNVLARSKDVPGAEQERSFLVTAFLQLLEECVKIKNEGVIQAILDSLEKLDVDNSHNKWFSSTEVCDLFCDKWRTELLEGVAYDGSDYSFVVEIAAYAMFQRPSSSLTLHLFGKIVGESSTDIPPNHVDRASVAVAKLAEVTSKQLVDTQEQPGSIFKKLAPLLLLRRVPSSLIRITKGQLLVPESSCNSIHLPSWHTLATMLAGRMGLTQTHQYSPEERRVASELFGIWILASEPYFDSNYSDMCRSAFRNCIKSLQSYLNRTSSSCQISALSAGRAALYAVCNMVACSQEKDNGTLIDDARVFALEVLGLDAINYSESIADDIARLKDGSMHFFAICFTKMFSSRFPELQRPDSRAVGSNIRVLFDDVQAVLTERASVQTNFSGSKQESTMHLWHVLTILSQKCDDQVLSGIVKHVLPWALEINYSKNAWQGRSRCLLGAMQFASTTLYRVLRQNAVDPQSLRKARRLSLNVLANIDLEPSTSQPNEEALKSASLKLLLTSLIADMDSKEPVSTDDIQEAFSVLKEISKDCSSPSGELASQVLSVISYCNY